MSIIWIVEERYICVLELIKIRERKTIYKIGYLASLQRKRIFDGIRPICMSRHRPVLSSNPRFSVQNDGVLSTAKPHILNQTHIFLQSPNGRSGSQAQALERLQDVVDDIFRGHASGRRFPKRAPVSTVANLNIPNGCLHYQKRRAEDLQAERTVFCYRPERLGYRLCRFFFVWSAQSESRGLIHASLAIFAYREGGMS